MPAEAPVIGQELAIPTDAIIVGERLRPVDPVWAGALARMIDRDGQHEASHVCRMPGAPAGQYQLVVGAHRHAACASLGRPLKATVGDAGLMARRSREVAEHLFRRDLDPVARSAFVAELIDVERTRAGLQPDTDGRAASAKARWARQQADDASDIVSLAYGWASDVAARVGLDRRTVYRDLELHRGLLPDVANALRRLQASQLRALARLDHDKQRRAVALIDEGRTAAQALAVLSGRKAPSLEDKRMSAFLGAFDRMSKAERASALRMLAARPLPVGYAITGVGQ